MKTTANILNNTTKLDETIDFLCKASEFFMAPNTAPFDFAMWSDNLGFEQQQELTRINLDIFYAIDETVMSNLAEDIAYANSDIDEDSEEELEPVDLYTLSLSDIFEEMESSSSYVMKRFMQALVAIKTSEEEMINILNANKKLLDILYSLRDNKLIQQWFKDTQSHQAQNDTFVTSGNNKLMEEENVLSENEEEALAREEEEALAREEEALAREEEALAREEEALAREEEEALAREEEALAREEEEALAREEEEALAREEEEALAREEEEALAREEEALAKEEEALTKEVNALTEEGKVLAKEVKALTTKLKVLAQEREAPAKEAEAIAQEKEALAKELAALARLAEEEEDLAKIEAELAEEEEALNKEEQKEETFTKIEEASGKAEEVSDKKENASGDEPQSTPEEDIKVTEPTQDTSIINDGDKLQKMLLLKQKIDNEIERLEASTSNKGNFFVNIGVIEASDSKILALTALSVILLNNAVTGKAQDSFHEELGQWKTTNMDCITKQRNCVHTFFSPKHKPRVVSVIEEIFAEAGVVDKTESVKQTFAG